MIIEVIPAVRLSRNLGSFSYKVPKELEPEVEIGKVVEVNFHGRVCPAVVVKMIKTSTRKLKEINKVLYKDRLITDEQISLICKMAEYYAVSPAIVFKSMLPDIPKREKFENFNLSVKRENKKFSKKFVCLESETDRINKYQKIIKTNKNKQVVIFVPTVFEIEKLIDSLDLNNEDIIKIYSGQKNSLVFKNWLDILVGQPKIILATKSGVFLPFNNLGTIIVDQENDWNHKQSDINPRYDTRYVAEWIAREQGAKLIMTGFSPSLEIYYELFGKETKNENKVDIEVVDLKQEQMSGNYSWLSAKMVDEINEVLTKTKKVFVLHNRRGTAGYVSCKDCGYVFLCPECEISLVYYNETKRIHCHHCNYQQDIPPLCPKCSGPNILFGSKGMEDIALKIKKNWPDKKIDLLFSGGEKYNIKSEIIVGTEFALDKLDWLKTGLVVVLNFDQLVMRPEFRANEKAWHMLQTVGAKLVNGKILLQTFNLASEVLENLNQPDKFYETELATRKILNYPPFMKLVKVFSQDKSKQRAYYVADKLIKVLKETKDIEVAGPLAAYPRKVRGKFRYNIIIKTHKDDKMLWLKEIDNDFVVDVDPEKLI